MIYRVKVNKRDKLDFRIQIHCLGSAEAKEIGLIRNYGDGVINGYQKCKVNFDFILHYECSNLIRKSFKKVEYILDNIPFDLMDEKASPDRKEIEEWEVFPDLDDKNIYTENGVLLNYGFIDFMPLGKQEVLKYEIDKITRMTIDLTDGENLVWLSKDDDFYSYIETLAIVKNSRTREMLKESLKDYFY